MQESRNRFGRRCPLLRARSATIMARQNGESMVTPSRPARLPPHDRWMNPLSQLGAMSHADEGWAADENSFLAALRML